MTEMTCPHCQMATNALTPVSSVLRQKIKIAHSTMVLPNSLCANCMSEMNELAGQGSSVLINEKTKEDSRAKLWRSRVSLLKKARNLMNRKSYGEAIINYEKYLRLLETVFEVKEAGLKPELFKERLATKELTIIASVYWDLLRVYDTNEKYRARMLTTAQKLIQFAPYTPIVIDLVKKADSYRGKARNPEIFKNLSRELMYKKNFCFIATCVFEQQNEWHYIEKFRLFRDRYLLKTPWGRSFISVYYRFSPSIVKIMEKFPLMKKPVRFILKALSQVFT